MLGGLIFVGDPMTVSNTHDTCKTSGPGVPMSGQFVIHQGFSKLESVTLICMIVEFLGGRASPSDRLDPA